jgi:hypothetical protein
VLLDEIEDRREQHRDAASVRNALGIGERNAADGTAGGRMGSKVGGDAYERAGHVGV